MGEKEEAMRRIPIEEDEKSDRFCLFNDDDFLNELFFGQ